MATIKTLSGAPEGKKPQGALRGLMGKLTALTGGMFIAKGTPKQPTGKEMPSRGGEHVRHAKRAVDGAKPQQERVLHDGMPSRDEVVRIATEAAERVAAKRLRDRYVGSVEHPEDPPPKAKEAPPAFDVEKFLNGEKPGFKTLRQEPEYGNGLSPGSGAGASRRRAYGSMKIEQTATKPDQEIKQAPVSAQTKQQGGVKRKVTRFLGLSH